jgi:hypothetical protein
LKDIIIKAVESNYLLEIEDETLVFLNQTPRTMLNHLCNRGGALDFADTKNTIHRKRPRMGCKWGTNIVLQLSGKGNETTYLSGNIIGSKRTN